MNKTMAAGAAQHDISTEVFGSLINLAGRQRMLSQRIVLQLVLASLQHAEAIDEARLALATFQETHAALTLGKNGYPAPFFDEVRSLFFGQAQGDAKLRAFIVCAQSALKAISTRARDASAAIGDLVAQSEPVLALLIQITLAYETEWKRRTGETKKQLQEMLANIQRVADQARIISFNAQVIAARAGAQGREFAVVASVLLDITSEMNQIAQRAIAISKQ